MIFDWHEAVGILSGVIQIAAIVPYIRDMLRGTTRPNIVSWGIWTFEVLITLSAQLSAGASWSLILLISATIINITVVMLGIFGWGYKKFGWIEGICLTLSVGALVLWHITAMPLVAIMFAIAADGIAYIPTIVKAYRDPRSETASFWFLLGIVGLLSAVSSINLNVANLAFPLYYMLINFVSWGIVIIGRKTKKFSK